MRSMTTYFKTALVSAVVISSFGYSTVRASDHIPMLTLSASDFQPRCSYIEYDSNGIRLTTLDNSDYSDCEGAVYLSAVHLPDDAKLQNLTVNIFQDNYSSGGPNPVNSTPVTVRFLRVRLSDHTFKELASVNFRGCCLKGAETSSEAIPDNLSKIDNLRYSYVLQLSMRYREHVKRHFYEAMIGYTEK